MKFNPDIHHRHSVRLRNYDYAQAGMYCITLCVQDRICMFGTISNGEMRPNEIGEIVRAEWLKTAELRPNMRLHNFVVMPNHFHGMFEIVKTENENDGNYVLQTNNDAATVAHVGAGRALPLQRQQPETPKPRTNALPKSRFQNIGRNTLSSIVGLFKSAVTKSIHAAGYDFVWQRNLREHVVRDYADYARIDDYISNNPSKWNEDTFFTKNKSF
jgi:REP element-mobilizing transposase RayT